MRRGGNFSPSNDSNDSNSVRTANPKTSGRSTRGTGQEEHEVQDDEQVGICGNEWDALGKNLIRRKKVIQFQASSFPQKTNFKLPTVCFFSIVLRSSGSVVLWSCGRFSREIIFFFRGSVCRFFSEGLHG